MTVTTRDAAPADAETLHAVYVESFDAVFRHLYDSADYDAFMTDHGLDTFRAELADPAYAFRLAETATGEAIGFAKIGPPSLPYDASGRTCVELRQLYLLDAAKGTGVADTLMNWALDAARARGAAEMWLSVFSDNHRARRFYAARDFVEIRSFQYMVGNHADDEFLCRRMLA